MAHSRRDFLRNTACALGGVALASTGERLGLINAYAQAGAATDYRALVCVFLSGGADTFNVLVPRGDSEYAEYSTVRGGIALKQNIPVNDGRLAVWVAVNIVPLARIDGQRFGRLRLGVWRLIKA